MLHVLAGTVTSTKRAGTGLGLALIREIAEAHGGRFPPRTAPPNPWSSACGGGGPIALWIDSQEVWFANLVIRRSSEDQMPRDFAGNATTISSRHAGHRMGARPVSEDAAAQVGRELALDVARQRARRGAR